MSPEYDKRVGWANLAQEREQLTHLRNNSTKNIIDKNSVLK